MVCGGRETYRNTGRRLHDLITTLPSEVVLNTPTAVTSAPSGNIFSSSNRPTCKEVGRLLDYTFVHLQLCG